MTKTVESIQVEARERIEELIKNDAATALTLFSEINSYNGGYETIEAYPMDFFDEYMYGYEPTDIANMVAFGNYNPYDEYFKFDGYGNIETLSEQSYENEVQEYAYELASDLIDAGLYENIWLDEDVQEIVDKMEEEIEELDE